MLLSGYCLPFYVTALPLFIICMLLSGYCLPFYATALPLFIICMLLSGYCLPFYVTALPLFIIYMLLSGCCLPFYATALPLFIIYMLLSGYCLPFYVAALLLFEALLLLLIISNLKPHFLFRSPYKISELVPLYISRLGQYLQCLFSAPNTRRGQADVLARPIIPTFTVHFTALNVYPSSTYHQTKLYCSCFRITCGYVHTLLTDCSLQDCSVCR